MKRIGYVVLAEIVLAGVLVSLAGAQSSESLGDYARSVRKEEKKGSAKKYDNDNLPATDKISVVGNASPETDNGNGNGDANAASTPDANAAQTGDSSAGSTPDAQPGAEKKPEVSDAQKANDDWKKKIDEQKAKVDLLSREMDVTQREYRLRAAAFYADAGNRLRIRVHGTRKTRSTSSRSPRNRKPWTTPRRHWPTCRSRPARQEFRPRCGSRIAWIQQSLRFRPEAF